MRQKHIVGLRWSLLPLILLLSVGGLVLEHELDLPSLGHKITLLLIIVLAYGLIAWWAKANAAQEQM